MGDDFAQRFHRTVGGVVGVFIFPVANQDDRPVISQLRLGGGVIDCGPEGIVYPEESVERASNPRTDVRGAVQAIPKMHIQIKVPSLPTAPFPLVIRRIEGTPGITGRAKEVKRSGNIFIGDPAGCF